MSVIVKRRQLILATLIVALGAAVFVNWYFTGNKSLKSGNETTENDFVQNLGEANYVNATENSKDSFAEMKLNRKKNRDEAIEKLNNSLKNTKAGTEEAKKITKSIEELTNVTKKEIDIESLVKGEVKGECFILINESSARIVVEKGKLNEKTALKIFEIVGNNTNLEPAQITASEA